MSVISKTPIEALEEITKLLVQKSECLEDIYTLNEGVTTNFIKLNDAQKEEEAYTNLIETRTPLLNKLKSLDERINEKIETHWPSKTIQPDDKINDSQWAKVNWLQSRCKEISEKIIKADNKIMSRLETLQNVVKAELSIVRLGKKAVTSYGNHTGKI